MGLLISVEGGEYTGKTSVVVPAIALYFKKKNAAVLVSREPGGTKRGELMRRQIFEKMTRSASQLELAQLFEKTRAIHLKERIIPFLGDHKEKSAVVVLDRYLDSTRVYQGFEGGVDLAIIKQLEKKYVGNYFPDLTLILYVPESCFETVMKQRMKQDRETTAWDRHDINVQKKRQRYFLKLPKLAKQWGEKRAFCLIDASQSKKVVIKQATDACQHLLARI